MDEDDIARLTRRLDRIAADEPRRAEGRILADAGGPALLGTLLTEIDETVLARRLTFRTDTGALTVEAYDRRLLRLLPPLPDGLRRGARALAGVPLAAIDEADLQRLLRVLDGFLDGASFLAVDTEPLRDRDPSQLGLSAAALAEAFGVTLDAAALPPSLDRVAPALIAEATAWLRPGDSPGAGGPPEAVARLADFVQAGLPGLDPADTEAPRCTVLGAQPGGGLLVVAEAQGEVLLLLASGERLAAVTAAWKRIFR